MVMTSSGSAATVVADLKSIVECSVMNDFSYFKLRCNQIEGTELIMSGKLTVVVIIFWDTFPIILEYRR